MKICMNYAELQAATLIGSSVTTLKKKLQELVVSGLINYDEDGTIELILPLPTVTCYKTHQHGAKAQKPFGGVKHETTADEVCII